MTGQQTPLPLYLASASPRRSQLLSAAGIAFEQFVVPLDEDALSEAYRGPLLQLGEYLARESLFIFAYSSCKKVYSNKI